VDHALASGLFVALAKRTVVLLFWLVEKQIFVECGRMIAFAFNLEKYGIFR
jgi:hypothetical protein